MAASIAVRYSVKSRLPLIHARDLFVATVEHDDRARREAGVLEERAEPKALRFGACRCGRRLVREVEHREPDTARVRLLDLRPHAFRQHADGAPLRVHLHDPRCPGREASTVAIVGTTGVELRA